MALKATVYKTSLQIADLDRHYYQTHDFTIACHPSETLTRMMLRIAVFALHAEQDLQFTKGISTDNEPDLWKKSLSGDIETWITLGQPDEKKIRKFSGRAKNVILYSYHAKTMDSWWQQLQQTLSPINNLQIYQVSEAQNNHLTDLVARSMKLHCSIDEDDICLSNGIISINLRRTALFPLQ